MGAGSVQTPQTLWAAAVAKGLFLHFSSFTRTNWHYRWLVGASAPLGYDAVRKSASGEVVTYL